MANRAGFLAILTVLAFLTATAASAGVVSRRISTDPEYWSAARFLSARPMRFGEIRRAELENLRRAAGPPKIETHRSETSASGGGSSAPPRARVAPRFDNHLFDPKLLSAGKYRSRADRGATRRSEAVGVSSAQALPGAVEPANRGTLLLDFSSSRLVPEEARVVWPFSAVGKLFFSSGGSNFVCSAAVVSSRVVLTAGHCVYDPGAGEFYTNFVFVPAYYRGEAPYGDWRPNFAATTDTWTNGGDEIPNDADFAVLVMDDQNGMKIGNVTGWLGYKLNELTPNQVKMLGYPANFDGGQRMHQIDSGAFQCCFGQTAIYGSDMKGGSSGGPWVQNFGVKSKGQRGGRNKQMNRVVGVTSYGPAGNSEKFQGSSIPAAEFMSLFNEACDDAAGNCSRRGKPKAP